MIFLRQRISTYIFCLLLAGLFWLLHALSKEYVITVKVPVSYAYLPGPKMVAVDLPDSVEAEIVGSGFTILAYQWTGRSIPIILDARNARLIGKGDFALPTYSHSEKIEGAFGHGLKILRVMPDTIVLSFEGRVQKTVPVRPKVNVTCAPMFRMGDSVRTIPGTITISGAEALISRISYVETETKSYEGLNRSVNEPVNILLPPDLRQVMVYPAKVNLIIPVGQYTEKKISLPVETINVPPDVVLKTFPDKVDVIFQVPVRDFAAITPEMFRLVADYSKIDEKSGTISVEFARQPLNVLNLHASPQRVEFLIRK